MPGSRRGAPVDAVFGARYSLTNQPLLPMQAAERGIEPRYFLPYGRKDGSTGWLQQKRQVRKGETSFKVWRRIERRPTEEEAQEWEAAGPQGAPRTVRAAHSAGRRGSPWPRPSTLG